MKLFSWALTLFSLLFASLSFAATSYIDCPPLETLMTNAVFNKGRYIELEKRWYLSTPGFKHRLQTWTLWLAAPLTTDNLQEALLQGAEYIKTTPKMVMPRPRFQDKYVFCFYTDPAAPDAVMAMTPPLDAVPFLR